MSRSGGRPEDGNDLLTTEQILKTREVPWESFTSLRLISDRDVQLIRKYDKRKRDTQAELLEQVSSARLSSGYGRWVTATISYSKLHLTR